MLVGLLDIFLFENLLIFVCYVLAVQNERDRISSRRSIPDSQDLPPITILAQAESLSQQVKIHVNFHFFRWYIIVCELITNVQGNRRIVTQETIIFCLPPDHCSSWNSRHIRAEVSHCWGCL